MKKPAKSKPAPKKSATKPAKSGGRGAFTAKVYVTYKDGVLDPQGQAILGALHSLGFENVKDVRAGKYFVLDLKARDRNSAQRAASEMCAQLLANPVLETASITITD
ncbi:MAG: phosphoribosylformylglycinamidine synthase subunit PurS [bacterium]